VRLSSRKNISQSRHILEINSVITLQFIDFSHNSERVKVEDIDEQVLTKIGSKFIQYFGTLLEFLTRTTSVHLTPYEISLGISRSRDAISFSFLMKEDATVSKKARKKLDRRTTKRKYRTNFVLTINHIN